MLAIFDISGLSKIVSAKCAPWGIIITKVMLLLMYCEAMKGDYNQGIKARNSVSKVIQPQLNFRFFKTAWLPNQTDCQETFAITSRHGATPQWRHSKWVTASTSPPHIEIIRCLEYLWYPQNILSVNQCRNNAFWHWILWFLKTHHA